MADNKSLSLDFNVQGLGFTASVKYDNALTYWSDKSISTTDDKIVQIRVEFPANNAANGAWFFQSFGEGLNREAGSIAIALELIGSSGVLHSYSVDASTEHIGLPERSWTINGTVNGIGDTVADKISSALTYYGNIDFTNLASGVVETEWNVGSGYLQSQSLGLNHDTAEVTYNRSYAQHETSYKDIWTVDYSQDEVGGSNDTISVAGTLQGLSSDKTARWTQVFNAFNDNFPDDATVWTTKVTPVLGANTPPSGFITSRSFSYDNITGNIGYNYGWNTSPSAVEIDYVVDASYDRTTDIWTTTLNGTIRGAGFTAADRINNALLNTPGEYAAWNHAYNTLITRLDNNASNSDVPKITQIPNKRYMVSRSFNANEQEGIVTFTFVWSTMESTYVNKYNDAYAWDDANATETVTRNGTIKVLESGNMAAAWTSMYNGGNPTCPNSVFATRHTTEFTDNANVKDAITTAAPISSLPRPTSVVSFDRAANIQNMSYNINHETREITYSFGFVFKAWPYSLPLWLTNVTIGFNKKKSLYVWSQSPVVGKLSGPVHQDMTSRSAAGFDVTISLTASKRKSDQFGSYLTTVLEEYTEAILRFVFLERSGYSAFSYGHDDSNRNCYLTNDTISVDPITGSVSRSVTIVMLDII